MSLLLRIHVPNDNCLFPECLDTQLGSDGVATELEWAVNQILGHAGCGSDALFQVQWQSGDATWLPYDKVSHLNTHSAYFELLEVMGIARLLEGSAISPDNIEFHVS